MVEINSVFKYIMKTYRASSFRVSCILIYITGCEEMIYINIYLYITAILVFDVEIYRWNPGSNITE